jgi:hypothetical protein
MHLNRFKQQRRLIETGLKVKTENRLTQTQKLEGDAATKFAAMVEFK